MWTVYSLNLLVVNYKKNIYFSDIYNNNKLDDSNKKIEINLNKWYEFLF
jgi:hypothetical protein